MRKKEIWVAGYPSLVGGADTELLANIELLIKKGVSVHLVPMFGFKESMVSYMKSLGCETHSYNKTIFKDKIVISYCNAEFLSHLQEIMEYGRPAQVIWFNCMTWTFPNEIVAHQNGWIDKFGFVSSYQRNWLLPELLPYNPVYEFRSYKPYFNPDSPILDLPLMHHSPVSRFNVGRISRADPAKFSSDMWNIFARIISPKPVKAYVLGYSGAVESKTGAPPQGLNYQWWPPHEISTKEFFSKIHLLIHKTGGSRESYGRIVPESYCCGIPVIVEDDYAFPDMVVNGVTGYRCKTSEEMSFRASELAFNEDLRKQLSVGSRNFLMSNMASVDMCWKAWGNLWD